MEQTVVECIATEYTMSIAEHTTFDYTMAMSEQTVVAAVQTTFMVATVMVSPSIGSLLLSYSTHPLSFLGEGHMLENPSLHGQ